MSTVNLTHQRVVDAPRSSRLDRRDIRVNKSLSFSKGLEERSKLPDSPFTRERLVGPPAAATILGLPRFEVGALHIVERISSNCR